MRIKICAAQMEVKFLDVEGNLKKARSLINEASNENCDIICFPELFLTGPLGEEISKYAQEIPGKYTDEFCRAANESGLYIVMGSIAERGGDSYYNTSALIDDSGNILGTYRKIKLWNGEKLYKKGGNEVSVIETKFGRIGLMICWDLAFPEISKEIALRGAKIIFCPSLWSHEDKYDLLRSEKLREKVPDIDTESNFIDSCVPTRAIENEVVFVYVNGCGKIETDKSTRNMVGHSQIAIPFYGTVASLKNEERLLVKEIDLSLLELAESVYGIRKDSKRNRAENDE